MSTPRSTSHCKYVVSLLSTNMPSHVDDCVLSQGQAIVIIGVATSRCSEKAELFPPSRLGLGYVYIRGVWLAKCITRRVLSIVISRTYYSHLQRYPSHRKADHAMQFYFFNAENASPLRSNDAVLRSDCIRLYVT